MTELRKEINKGIKEKRLLHQASGLELMREMARRLWSNKNVWIAGFWLELAIIGWIKLG